MIPIFVPPLRVIEPLLCFIQQRFTVHSFEKEFAHYFGAKYAIAFPYGRVAQFGLFESLGISGKEIILPSYTCSVVAHSISMSGNKARFIDINRDTFNMNLDELELAINEETRAIVATHTFGFAQDIVRLKRIRDEAQIKFGNRIYLVQDCAHIFNGHWKSERISNSGDVAIYGLNISKQMSSIFGGMLTTDDPFIAGKVREWVNLNLENPGLVKEMRRIVYLIAARASFTRPGYSISFQLQNHSNILKRWTDSYHRDDKIHFPPDSRFKMSNIEACVGMDGISRLELHQIVRQTIANRYRTEVEFPRDWIVPNPPAGSTYSHFPISVPNRENVIYEFRKKGLELGKVIDYSIPHLESYFGKSHPDSPNSLHASRSTINLPLHESGYAKFIRILRSSDSF